MKNNSGFIGHCPIHSISVFFVTLTLSASLAAQSWDFIKEKDGIKIYTRQDSGKDLKSYRGVADINAPAEKIFALMEDINNTNWWDKNIIQLKVLLYEKNKRAQYYMVYTSPWPVTNRDICVNVTITNDPVTGERTIDATSVSGVIPERNDIVRIKDFRQKWTIIPAGKEMTHVILEGYIDPAGSIPDWISNMLIANSPYKAIVGVREHVGK
jgi:hypothetical protein